MKAIIHIGMPKTGSAAIQTWMRSNRAALEDGGKRSIGVEEPLRESLTFAPLHVALREMGIDERTLQEDMEFWMRHKLERIDAWCFVSGQWERMQPISPFRGFPDSSRNESRHLGPSRERGEQPLLQPPWQEFAEGLDWIPPQ